MRRSARLLLLVSGAAWLVLLLGACATTETVRRIPIAGGKVIDVAIGPQGPRPGQADGFTVVLAALMPSPEPGTNLYRFGFTAPPGAALHRVRVEDVSDERVILLLDDAAPALRDHQWSGATAPLAAADPRLAWLYHVVPSLRVFRFTLTGESGHVTELYQLAAYPPFIKEAIRRQRGETTP